MLAGIFSLDLAPPTVLRSLPIASDDISGIAACPIISSSLATDLDLGSRTCGITAPPISLIGKSGLCGGRFTGFPVTESMNCPVGVITIGIILAPFVV